MTSGGLHAAESSPADQNEPYRVGIVAYDDIRDRALKMNECFAATGHNLRFASGTAEEVLDWISDGLIDLAIVSPGALAATTAVLTPEQQYSLTETGQLPAWNCRYLVTPQLPTSRSPFASAARKTEPSYEYESLCLLSRKCFEELRREYKGSDAEILCAAAKAGRLQFVFGDPLSLSGTIVPKALLTEMNVFPDETKTWEFSFGHRDTIDLLLKEPQVTIMGRPRIRVGFVYDASVPDQPEDLVKMERELVSIRLPRPSEPSQYERNHRTQPGGKSEVLNDLPGEVWVVRSDFDTKKGIALRKALLELNGGKFNFRVQTEAELSLLAARVQHWSKLGNIDLGNGMSTRPIAFAEIIHSMRHYSRFSHNPPRLALVLSGGGAKCAYQAGAIERIEKLLDDLHDFKVQSSDPANFGRQIEVAPDINLVVGTSGGALNALPVAIGVTAKRVQAGRNDLSRVWTSINLTSIFSPFHSVAALIGIVLAATASLITWLLVATIKICWRLVKERRLNFEKDCLPPSMPVRWAVVTLLLLVPAARLFSPDYVGSVSPENRWIYYLLWFPLCIGGLWAALSLALVLTFEYLWVRRRPRNQENSSAPNASWEVRFWRGFGVLVLSAILLAYFALWQNRSLSDADKMQSVVAGRILDLLHGEVRPNRSETGDLQQRITALSAAIAAENQVRRRDLVMTVSLLGDRRNADRYVYLPAKLEGSDPPTYGQRAIQIQSGGALNFMEGVTQIVPLMIASGTIFPVFPARPFQDPTGFSQDLFVVDGGFAHNSPIEAAVDWGATHIIIVEASPSKNLRQERNFLLNLGVAFDHLFEQAQLTDLRSRQRIEIFTLRPPMEILKTLDFIPSLVDKAVQQGDADVRCGRFTQVSRPPKLVTIVSDNKTTPGN